MAYPLTIYNSQNIDKEKTLIEYLTKTLIKKLDNWKELKPIRGLIEDFFKVAKDAFKLGKFHKYTKKSISKSIYLTILLTSIIIQYDTTLKQKCNN